MKKKIDGEMLARILGRLSASQRAMIAVRIDMMLEANAKRRRAKAALKKQPKKEA